MFVLSYILIGRCLACHIIVAGFFYARTLTICGSVPPCNSVMELLPIRCKTAGKAEPFFNFCPYIKLCKMSYTEKTFVANSQIGGYTTQTDITDLIFSIRMICNIDKDQKILKTLHHMYISAVRNRDLLPDGELDRITNLYECLKDFYEVTAKDLRHA